MKANSFLIALLPAALALPLATPNGDAPSLSGSQGLQSITDELLFGIELPDFTARREANDPPQLDWYSDGCTKAPSNPLGFPFQRACERHDFGYQNYRIQGRFTKAAKAQIDLRFKEEYDFPFVPSLSPRACFS
ncbi:prokaryotic phospholipase A2-domain-containing protein [Aspergillus pseudotamarii]|uniref:Prokaryotic phospholipase A2-domain-containing protein n=1 Tax=Aspergillus pseudotamarii TaxID=132259 RepID=A0A5N6SV75_ASPPS|nr:prokaryotic phospholipase A2-domain-containing protein [Aspergillus pseudotamarii]KAE8137024.1 prokaryotic phospholipase A2-domain-containing protein [Aspergillus pseudotamarii]